MVLSLWDFLKQVCRLLPFFANLCLLCIYTLAPRYMVSKVILSTQYIFLRKTAPLNSVNYVYDPLLGVFRAYGPVPLGFFSNKFVVYSLFLQICAFCAYIHSRLGKHSFSFASLISNKFAVYSRLFAIFMLRIYIRLRLGNVQINLTLLPAFCYICTAHIG